MAHAIEAFIGPASVMRTRFAWCAPLTVELVLVPVDEGLFRDEEPIAPFYALRPSILAAARASLSPAGYREVPTALGYIETDYFGGPGDQRGAAWLGDTVLVAPQEAADIVNAVLRALGVVRDLGKDEWDTVGLARYRSNDTILAAAMQGR
jgi:hypothetical protein